MQTQEGVIKYRLEYTKSAAIKFKQCESLTKWRNSLFELGLIGRQAGRYNGDAYGNVSCRHNNNASSFIITGTQSSHLPVITNEHYSHVLGCDLKHNQLTACGPVKPSSEALTHFAVYESDNDIQFVFHVHSPEIWKMSQQLEIPETDANIQYGTVEMADCIEKILRNDKLKSKHIICMKGHQDGILSFAETADKAGNTLINYLSLSRQWKSLT